MEEDKYYKIAEKLAEALLGYGEWVVCDICGKVARDGYTCNCAEYHDE